MTIPPLNQILALVGKLDDSEGNDAPRERFRRFLTENIREVGQLRNYIEECLINSGTLQYNRALQDLVNRLGELLEFKVTYGRYQGVRGQNGFDGHWISSLGVFHIVTEVKTSEVYPIKTSALLGYIDGLISDQQIPSWDEVSGLYVVGRIDEEVQQLESRIIAEKRTHLLRSISVKSLLSLAEMMEQYSLTHKDILSLLRPSSPRIDAVVDLMKRLAEKPTVEEGEITEPVPDTEEEEEQSNDSPSERSRLTRGQRTSEDAFYLPILKALDEMGGSAHIKDVLARVGQLMKEVLKEVDYQPVSSDGNLLRWRNTAQWARQNMVYKGLLKNNSPRGFWEISEAGRQYLAKNKN